jgi:hypothetical protein
MLNTWPAMVALPVRAVVPVLAATFIVTGPLPVPLAPLVMVSHAALLVAVQAQVEAAVTLTVSISPLATAVPDDGVIEYVHATPAWLRVTGLSPTTIVAVRAGPELAAIE